MGSPFLFSLGFGFSSFCCCFVFFVVCFVLLFCFVVLFCFVLLFWFVVVVVYMLLFICCC